MCWFGLVYVMCLPTSLLLPIVPIVTELFLRGRIFNISLVFISQPYFKEPKTIRLNARHYFIIKIPKKISNFNK